MEKCSVGSAFFTTHCNYTLRVYFQNRVPFKGPPPGSAGNSARGWRGVRPSFTDSASLSDRVSRDKGYTARRREVEAELPPLTTPHNPSPPVTFVSGLARRQALATALATAGLLPPVSPGKRSAALERDLGRARASGSGGAEDAWSCARTRGQCRSESHSDPWCGSRAPLRNSGLAGVVRLQEEDAARPGPSGGRAGCRLWAGPWSLCSSACLFLGSCGPFGKKASRFFLKIFLCPNNHFQVVSALRKVCSGR